MGSADLVLKVVYFAFDLGPLDFEQSCFGAHGLEVLVDHVVFAGHLGQLDLIVRGD